MSLHPVQAQGNSSIHEDLQPGLNLRAELSGKLSSGSMAPLWLTANRYGTVSPYDNSAYERIGIFRPLQTDSLRKWKRGIGLDIQFGQNALTPFIIHQAYLDISYKRLTITIGAKEQPVDLRQCRLTSGGLSTGMGAHPIPQVRLALDYFSFPWTRGWWKWRARMAYGITTDGRWQRDFARQGTKYTSNVLYHEKALYWKFGKEEATRCPLTFEIGIQMFTLFGGTVYNMKVRGTPHPAGIQLPQNLRSFWEVTTERGSDFTDFPESNSLGNTLGSYNMRLAWHGHTPSGKPWHVGAYFERYFEDQSMITLQYGIQDHLLGIDAQLPSNPFLTAVAVEHLSTRDQSGAVYHDKTPSIPDKMNGRDNYYNHNIYTGWQHWGMGLGHPLLTAPAYNDNHTLCFRNNRVKAWHLALTGNPSTQLRWRLLLTLTQNWGTYDEPFRERLRQQYYLAEIDWHPRFAQGWSGTLGLGLDHGDVLGNSFGAQLTLRRNLKLTH